MTYKNLFKKIIPWIGFIVLFLIGNWIFNHIAAWVGFLVCIVVVLCAVCYAIVKYNAQTDEEYFDGLDINGNGKYSEREDDQE